MNIRKPTDYSILFSELDRLMAEQLSQMNLDCEIGRLVSSKAPSLARMRMPTATSIRAGGAAASVLDFCTIAQSCYVGNAGAGGGCWRPLGAAAGIVARKLLGHAATARAAL